MKNGLWIIGIAAVVLFAITQIQKCSGGSSTKTTVERDTTFKFIVIPANVPDSVSVTPEDRGLVDKLMADIDSIVQMETFHRHEGYRLRAERNDARELLEKYAKTEGCEELISALEAMDFDNKSILASLSASERNVKELVKVKRNLERELNTPYQNVFSDSTDQYSFNASVISRGFSIPKENFTYDLRFKYLETSETTKTTKTKYRNRKNILLGFYGKDVYGAGYVRSFGAIGLGGQAVYLNDKIYGMGALKFSF